MGVAHRDPLVPGETTRSVDRPAYPITLMQHWLLPQYWPEPHCASEVQLVVPAGHDVVPLHEAGRLLGS